MVVGTGIQKGIKWRNLTSKLGLSRESLTASCLGEMSFDKNHATTIGRIFSLPSAAVALLQAVPCNASPTRPATGLISWCPASSCPARRTDQSFPLPPFDLLSSRACHAPHQSAVAACPGTQVQSGEELP